MFQFGNYYLRGGKFVSHKSLTQLNLFGQNTFQTDNHISNISSFCALANICYYQIITQEYLCEESLGSNQLKSVANTNRPQNVSGLGLTKLLPPYKHTYICKSSATQFFIFWAFMPMFFFLIDCCHSSRQIILFFWIWERLSSTAQLVVAVGSFDGQRRHRS